MMQHSFPGRAIAAFLLMAILTAHYATGALFLLFPKRPRPLEAFNQLIDGLLADHIGRPVTIALLVLLTLALPLLVHRRSVTYVDNINWQ